jgi:hypothetical protein
MVKQLIKLERIFIFKLVSFLFSITALMWLSFDNGFPILYHDTGAYIFSGIFGQVPIDRPITYGLFIKFTSLSLSLWCVVFFQSAIIVYLIFLYLKFVLKTAYTFTLLLLITLILSFTTGISYYAAQVMPDIFSGIFILSFILLIYKDELKGLHVFFLKSIYVLSIVVHLSNLNSAFVGTLIILCFVFIVQKFNPNWKSLFSRVLGISFLSLFALLITPSIHYYYDGSFKYAKTSHIFLMGRMAESGALKAIANDSCEKRNYSFCSRMNGFDNSSNTMMWSFNSPLYNDSCLKKGWGTCWLEKKEEYDAINKAILMNAKYRNLYLKDSFLGTFRQLATFDCDRLYPLLKGTAPFDVIRDFYKNDFKSFLASVQNADEMNFELISNVQFYVLILSLFGILVLLSFLIRNKQLNPKLSLSLISMILFFCINAATCAFFSCVLHRYQGRVVWLLPLMFIFILLEFISLKKAKD